MRELIRPALFLVTRLGLFFAVATWILAQCWIARVVYSPATGTGVDCGIYRSSWYVNLFTAGGTMLEFEYCSASRDEVSPKLSDKWNGEVWRIPGMFYVNGTYVWLFIYHWLVVSIFALIYVLLKYIYGRRPDGDRRRE